MVDQLLAENILIGGYDSGNTKDKISFLDHTGNIQSFEIPKVLAPAPDSKVRGQGPKEQKLQDLDLLHVRVRSKSLDHKDNNKPWYVGLYAKDKKGKMEPTLSEEGIAEDKFSQTNKKLHVIPLITGISIAAIRSGKTNVKVPFSGGMPIEDYKNRGDEYIIDLLTGEHEIEFIDGPYEDQKVAINITSATINIEGVHSTLALEFDIVDGEIVEIANQADLVNGSFLINDCGAGTTDNAVFKDGILDKDSSTNSFIGTNKYIDEIIRDIKKELYNRIQTKEKYSTIRNFFSESTEGPIKTREEFVKNYLEPEIDKIIEQEKLNVSKEKEYQPKFFVKWGPVKGEDGKGEDVTDIVMGHIKKYADEQIEDLMKIWIETGVDRMINVGGGVLFGYPHLKELKMNPDIVFPENIKESPYFTSRSYLISNYSEQLEKHAIEA